MARNVLKTINLLFQFVGVLAQFLVWDVFSNGGLRRRKRPTLQPARLLQEEAIYLRRQMRKLEDQHRMSIDELERRYQDKLKLQARRAIIN